MAAFIHHMLQLFAERRELGDTPVHLNQVMARNAVGLGAGSFWLRAQIQQFANRIQFEAKFAGVTDEVQSGGFRRVVAALFALGARRRGNKPDLFIIADRRNLHPRKFRQFADRNFHGRPLEPLVAIGCKLFSRCTKGIGMADHCCDSGDSCCAPPPLKFPEPPAEDAAADKSCGTDAACGCHGGVPRFDGVDPRYKSILWTVIAINGVMFLTEVVAGQLAGSQALKADALDFLANTVTYGLSLAVIGASQRTRASAALLKGASLGLMATWVMASTIYHTLILGLPSAELMGGIGVLALAANVASVLLLLRYKDGDANVRSVWLCSRNDAIGNVVVMIAALGVWSTSTAWPDLAVAAVMAGIFLSSSVQILRQAWTEYRHEGGHSHAAAAE